jgi:exonuclease I
VNAGGWESLDFSDKRLNVLVSRLKARSFPDRQSSEEALDWHEFVVDKLNSVAAPWLTLSAYFEVLDEIRVAATEQPASGRILEVVDELTEHGRSLAARYSSRAATTVLSSDAPSPGSPSH